MNKMFLFFNCVIPLTVSSMDQQPQLMTTVELNAAIREMNSATKAIKEINNVAKNKQLSLNEPQPFEEKLERLSKRLEMLESDIAQKKTLPQKIEPIALNNSLNSNVKVNNNNASMRGACYWTYNRTYNFINSYDPHNEKSIKELFVILNIIKEHKKSNVTERDLGHYAYTESTQLSEKLFSIVSDTRGKFYIALLFERINAFNRHLEKSKLLNPDMEEFYRYYENKQQREAHQNIVQEAAQCGIYLDQDIAGLSLSENSSVEAFEQLTLDIEKIYHKDATTVEEIAKIIYDTEAIKNKLVDKTKNMVEITEISLEDKV